MTPTEEAEYQEGKRTRKALTLCLLIGAAAVALAAAIPRSSPGWTSIGVGQTRAICGLALIGSTPAGVELLVVHDSKRAGEVRLASLTVGREQHYTPLIWPEGAALPVDLEAVTTIPGEPGHFLVATSAGQVTVIGVLNRSVTVLGAFLLPDLPPEANVEGLSVWEVDGVRVIVWGNRGAGRAAGRLYWGTFDLQARTVANVESAAISVPYPNPVDSRTRHISDLRIDASGHVWGTAAFDAGDFGPFTSALYDLGVIGVSSTRVTFTAAAPLVPRQTFLNKVEAIELLNADTMLALGSDDELLGGTVRLEARP